MPPAPPPPAPPPPPPPRVPEVELPPHLFICFSCVTVFATHLESYDHHLTHGPLDPGTPLPVLVLANRAMSIQACALPELARRRINRHGIQGPPPPLPIQIRNQPSPIRIEPPPIRNQPPPLPVPIRLQPAAIRVPPVDVEIPVVGEGIAYRPAPIRLQVNLRHPANFLRVAGIAHFPATFTFITTFPVTAKARPTEFLGVIRNAFQARYATRYNSPAPQMRWKDWSHLKFIFKVDEGWWKLQGNVENLLPRPEGDEGVVSLMIVELGVL